MPASTKGARRNDITAILLIVLLSLAPIPLGSNRPALWVLVDTAVFAILFAQAVMRYFDRSGRNRRFLPQGSALQVLFAAVVIWHVVQILPIGRFLPVPGPANAAFGQTISLVPGQTILMLMNFLAYGAVFALAYQVGQRPSRSRRILTVTAYIMGLFALYSLYNFAAQNNALLGLPRQFYIHDAAGTFVNRNSFATFLGLGLVLNVGLAASALFDAVTRQERPDLQSVFLHATVAAVIAAGILATHSRMGLFSSFAGALVTFALFMFGSGMTRRIRAASIALAVLGAIALAILYGRGIFERLGSSQDAFDVRNALYAQVWDLILMRPFWGFGAGSFEAAFPLIHHLPVSPDRIWDKAHDTYLTALVELGAVFGIFPVLMVGLLTVRAWYGVRFGGSARLGGAVLLGSTTLVGIHSLLDFSLEIHAVALLYAFILGLGVAAAQTTRQR